MLIEGMIRARCAPGSPEKLWLPRTVAAGQCCHYKIHLPNTQPSARDFFHFPGFSKDNDDLKAQQANPETRKRVQRLNAADSLPMILQL